MILLHFPRRFQQDEMCVHISYFLFQLLLQSVSILLILLRFFFQTYILLFSFRLYQYITYTFSFSTFHFQILLFSVFPHQRRPLSRFLLYRRIIKKKTSIRFRKGKQFNTTLPTFIVCQQKKTFFVWKNNGIVKFYYVIHPSCFTSFRIIISNDNVY